VRPVVRPLSEFPPGASVRIVFLTPSFHQRLDRLSSFGVLPGAVVRLHQKHPACVLRVGATEVALEREVAGEIYAIGVD
jgi:DtxR family Mn-dependent transcriptional regulator